MRRFNSRRKSLWTRTRVRLLCTLLQLPRGMHDAACRAQSLGNRIWIVGLFGPWQSYPIASQIVQPGGACLALATMRALSGIKSYIWIPFASSSIHVPYIFGNLLLPSRRLPNNQHRRGCLCAPPCPALCVLRVIPFPPASNRKSNTQRQWQQLLLASVFAWHILAQGKRRQS